MAACIQSAVLVLALGCSGCAGIVQYTDELRDDRTDRTLFVRTPATVGGVVGFAVGLPVSAIALPVTYTVHVYQREQTPLRADPVSTMLFPSFALWRIGSLIALPFDLVEWAGYRAWRSEPTLTAEEREQVERRHDEDMLRVYPVDVIYPAPEHRARAAGAVGVPGTGFERRSTSA